MINKIVGVQRSQGQLIGIVSTDLGFEARIRSALRNGAYSIVSANDFRIHSLGVTDMDLIVVDARTAAACKVASEARDSDSWGACPMIGVFDEKHQTRELMSQYGSQVFDVEIGMDFTDGEIVEWVRRITWRA